VVDEIVKKGFPVTFYARGGFRTIGAELYSFYNLLFCGDGVGQGYLNPHLVQG